MQCQNAMLFKKTHVCFRNQALFPCLESSRIILVWVGSAQVKVFYPIELPQKI